MRVELDLTLGKLRREARDASNAGRAAEQQLAAAETERDELRARVEQLSAEGVRARADGDRLREHCAILGDELADARAAVAELQAAASAPPSVPAPVAAPAPSPGPGAVPAAEVVPAFVAAPPVATRSDESSEESSERRDESLVARSDPERGDASPPPLPLRVAGQKAPAPPLARRRPRPRREPAVAGAQNVAGPVPVAARGAGAGDAEVPPAAPEASVPEAEVAPGPAGRECVPPHGVGRVQRARDERQRRLHLPPPLTTPPRQIRPCGQ